MWAFYRRTVPQYKKLVPPKAQMERLTIHDSTGAIRPVCVAAVLRNVTFTQER